MATRDVCITLLSEKTKLEPEELSAVADYIEEFKKRTDQKGQDFLVEFNKELNNRKAKVKMREVQNVISIEKYEAREKELFQDAFKDDPVAAIESFLHTQNKNYVGEGNVYRTTGQIKNKAFSMIDKTLMEFPGLAKRFRRGDKALTKQMYMALHPTKGVDMKLPPEILKLASSIKNMNDYIYKAKNDAGFFVNYIENYINKQFHPAKAIRELGYDGYGELARNTWDFDTMGIAPDKIDQFIDYEFNNLSKKDLGRNVLTDDFKEAIAPKYVRNIEGGRSIHFKDGAAAFEYAEALGGGHNFLDNIYKGVESDAKKIAAAMHFGPNSKSTFDRLITTALNSPYISEKQITKLKQNTPRLQSMFDMGTSRLNKPEKNLLAKIGQVLRMITDMSKLKTALFSTVTDISGGSGIMSAVNKTNFLEETFHSMRTMWDAIPIKGERNRRLLANHVGVFLDDSLGFSNARFYEESGALGMFSKFHKKVMELTGLPAQSQGMRVGFAARASELLARDSNLKWDMLPQRDALAKFGIGEKEWNIIRTAVDDIVVDPKKGNTRKLITPERVTSISKSDTLGIKLGSYLEDIAEIGSPTPGLKQRTWKANVDENTIMGQLSLFTMKFRSFIMAQQDTMMRIAHAGGPSTLAPTIVSYITMGYIAMQMKQMAQGRYVSLPTNAEEGMNQFMDAITQSGVGMLYGDILFADLDMSWQSIPSLVAGPTLGGVVSDLASAFAIARGVPFAGDKEKQLDRLGRKTMQVIEKNMPSLFFGQVMLNKAIFNAINEGMNPGSSYKRNKRLEQSNIVPIFK